MSWFELPVGVREAVIELERQLRSDGAGSDGATPATGGGGAVAYYDWDPYLQTSTDDLWPLLTDAEHSVIVLVVYPGSHTFASDGAGGTVPDSIQVGWPSTPPGTGKLLIVQSTRPVTIRLHNDRNDGPPPLPGEPVNYATCGQILPVARISDLAQAQIGVWAVQTRTWPEFTAISTQASADGQLPYGALWNMRPTANGPAYWSEVVAFFLSGQANSTRMIIELDVYGAATADTVDTANESGWPHARSGQLLDLVNRGAHTWTVHFSVGGYDLVVPPHSTLTAVAMPDLGVGGVGLRAIAVVPTADAWTID